MPLSYSSTLPAFSNMSHLAATAEVRPAALQVARPTHAQAELPAVAAAEQVRMATQLLELQTVHDSRGIAAQGVQPDPGNSTPRSQAGSDGRRYLVPRQIRMSDDSLQSAGANARSAYVIDLGYIHMYMYGCMNECMYVCIACIYVYMYVLHVYTYICMYAYIDIHTYTYICVCMWVYTSTCVRLCVRACVSLSLSLFVYI